MGKVLVLVAVAVCAGAFHVGTAKAIGPCGTITSSTTLTDDCIAPLTIGASGVTVDLNRHFVICTSAVNGIVIPSWVQLAIVQRGLVLGASLSDPDAKCVTGVQVEGSSNQVNQIDVFSAGKGFQVGTEATGANFNRLMGDEAESNASDGFIVFGSYNTVSGGFSLMNQRGISFFHGVGNKVSQNGVVRNYDKDIVSGSDQTIIASNRVGTSPYGIYLSDNSTGSTIYQNRVALTGTGIDITPTSSGNVIYSNFSRGNTLDMNDENAFCDGNIWNLNTFDTANQGCIH